MTLVKEIRILNGEPYYCSVSYDNNKYGSIISVNKHIVARLNRETEAEIKDGKITNIIKEEKQIEIKPVETPEKSEVETELKETKDEIKDEVTINGDEENMDLNEESVIRKVEDRLESKNRTEKLEQELADQRKYMKGFESLIVSKLDGFNEKFDTMAKQKAKDTTQSIIDQQRIAAASAAASAEHNHSKDEIKCTGSSCGHSMKKSNDGNTLKCSGPGCHKEMALIDVDKMKKADGYCLNCHTPLISKEDEDCPTCHGHKGNLYPK